MEESNVPNDRVEVAKRFSDIGRNAPRVSFRITYTGTPGNLRIDKSFQEFCHYYANNEYLAGIGVLLEAFYHFKQMASTMDEVKALSDRVKVLEETPKEEVKAREFKTF